MINSILKYFKIKNILKNNRNHNIKHYLDVFVFMIWV